MQDLYLGNDGTIRRCCMCYCPHCRRPEFGGFALLYQKSDQELYYVQCRNCGRSTNNYPTREQAIARWNKRVAKEERRLGDAKPAHS